MNHPRRFRWLLMIQPEPRILWHCLGVSTKMGIPPVIIHFERWDFPWTKPSSYGGTIPWLWKPPYGKQDEARLFSITGWSSKKIHHLAAERWGMPFQKWSFFHRWLVVGPPLWKIWVRQLGWLLMIIPNIWENTKWQPNHQPDREDDVSPIFVCFFWSQIFGQDPPIVSATFQQSCSSILGCDLEQRFFKEKTQRHLLLDKTMWSCNCQGYFKQPNMRVFHDARSEENGIQVVLRNTVDPVFSWMWRVGFQQCRWPAGWSVIIHNPEIRQYFEFSLLSRERERICMETLCMAILAMTQKVWNKSDRFRSEGHLTIMRLKVLQILLHTFDTFDRNCLRLPHLKLPILVIAGDSKVDD